MKSLKLRLIPRRFFRWVPFFVNHGAVIRTPALLIDDEQSIVDHGKLATWIKVMKRVGAFGMKDTGHGRS